MSSDQFVRAILEVRDEISRLREEIKRREKAMIETLSRLDTAISKLNTAINELNVSSYMDKIAQYCSEAQTMRDLNFIVSRYSGILEDRLKEEVNSRIEELHRIDEEAKRSLIDLLKVAFDFKKRVKMIKGDQHETEVHEAVGTQSSGIRRLHEVVSDAFKLLESALERRKGVMIEIQSAITSTTSNIRGENDQIIGILKEYSIPNEYGGPVIIGVPVISLSVNGVTSQVYLGKGLDAYEHSISYWASRQSSKVDQDLLTLVLRELRKRKGPLYKLFLSLKVKVG